MAYYSGFQSNAFQRNAFQIKGGAVEPDNGWLGGGLYLTPYQKYKEEEYQRNKIAQQKAELKRVDDKIAEAERKRLQELAKLRAKKNAAKLKAALEAELLEQINLLRNQRAALIQRIQEEESILVILLMARRRRFRVV